LQCKSYQRPGMSRAGYRVRSMRLLRLSKNPKA
jgi:hypothetical protein